MTNKYKQNNKVKVPFFRYRQIHENSKQYYKVDGIYQSFWLGKFLNFFIKKGKKYKAHKHMYTCLLLIKVINNVSPLLYWFEILEKIKPTFKLISIFPSKKMVIYPKAILGSKQYIITLKWLREIVISEYPQTRKSKVPFYRVMLSSFEYLQSSKNRSLLRKRDNYLSEAIRLQDHIRFTWVSI